MIAQINKENFEDFCDSYDYGIVYDKINNHFELNFMTSLAEIDCNCLDKNQIIVGYFMENPILSKITTFTNLGEDVLTNLNEEDKMDNLQVKVKITFDDPDDCRVKDEIIVEDTTIVPQEQKDSISSYLYDAYEIDINNFIADKVEEDFDPHEGIDVWDEIYERKLEGVAVSFQIVEN